MALIEILRLAFYLLLVAILCFSAFKLTQAIKTDKRKREGNKEVTTKKGE